MTDTETSLTTATIAAGTTGAIASLLAGQTGSLLYAVIALVALLAAVGGTLLIGRREGIWRRPTTNGPRPRP